MTTDPFALYAHGHITLGELCRLTHFSLREVIHELRVRRIRIRRPTRW